MFCKNCGTQNNDESKFCICCGQELTNYDDTNDCVAMESVKTKKKIIIPIAIILSLVVIIGLVLISVFRSSTPNIDRLKSDFSYEIIGEKKYSINTFDVVSETENGDNQYKTIVKVVYGNKEKEFHRQYEFNYVKYKKWTLSDLKGYKKIDWYIVPKKAPSVSDYTNECKETITLLRQVDKFAPEDDKTTADLSAGKATFVFSVEKNTKVRKISGEININYVFNKHTGIWELEDYSNADSYKEEFNLLNTWSGTGYPYLISGDSKKENSHKFNLTITKFDEKSAEGVLSYDNEKYNLSGTLEKESTYLDLSLYNEEDRKYVGIMIEDDGTATADINIDYYPNDIVYYSYAQTRFNDVKMSMK